MRRRLTQANVVRVLEAWPQAINVDGGDLRVLHDMANAGAQGWGESLHWPDYLWLGLERSTPHSYDEVVETVPVRVPAPSGLEPDADLGVITSARLRAIEGGQQPISGRVDGILELKAVMVDHVPGLRAVKPNTVWPSHLTMRLRNAFGRKLADGDKQIRDFRRILGFPAARGITVVVNDGSPSLDPDVAVAFLGTTLAELENTDAIIYLSDRPDRPHISLIPKNREDDTLRRFYKEFVVMVLSVDWNAEPLIVRGGPYPELTMRIELDEESRAIYGLGAPAGGLRMIRLRSRWHGRMCRSFAAISTARDSSEPPGKVGGMGIASELAVTRGSGTGSPFFLEGDALDVGYVATRDHPRGRAAREFCEGLWARYAPLADRHFRQEARSHFHQRFWEMYLGVTLLERGVELRRQGDEGPEFYATVGGRRVWFEAIAPGPGEGADRVPDLVLGEAQYVPTEKILLRFTSALAEKRQRYLSAVNKRIIHADDAYVVAMNSRDIPHAFLGGDMPYFVQAFLPFGPLTAYIDTQTLKITKTVYAYREAVRKANDVAISTRPFLDPEASSFCSAVLHSVVDCANHPPRLGDDFAVLHNPNAATPIGSMLFSWCDQLYLRGTELHREPAPSSMC